MVLAFSLRVRGVSNSVTDWHAFRQADTASVTREFVKHGVDLLHPRYQDLSNIQSGKDNLEGYRMVEFPIINALVAMLVRTVPTLDLVTTSRFVMILFGVGTTVSIFGVGRAWAGKLVGFAAAVVYAVLPFARYYDRAVLPEGALICFVTASVYFFDRWLQSRLARDYIASLLFLALALLLKPFVAFFGLVYLVLAIQKFRWRVWLHIELVLFGALAFLPTLWWQHWITQFPTGVPARDWLFNGNGIRLRPAWFRWLFWERLTKLIGGGVGSVILAFAIWPRWRDLALWVRLTAWWLGVLAYWIVIATGSVQHDYYQVPVLPIYCLTLGVGLVYGGRWLVRRRVAPSMAAGIMAVLLGMNVWVSWQFVKGYYGTRADWETAGRAADQLLPADAKVIAPAFGDTSFLFQTNRTGWPIGFEISDKIAKGATHYVTTSYDAEAKELELEYATIAKTKDYLIFDLRAPLPR